MKYENDIKVMGTDIVMVHDSFKEQVIMIVDSEEEMKICGVDESGCFADIRGYL